MANWGEAKYVLGEVDVFKLDHTHELYGHMNVNYIRLDPIVCRGFRKAGGRCSTACAWASSSSRRVKSRFRSFR